MNKGYGALVAWAARKGMMKRAVVCGAGGFIGHHLVKRLKREGYWVRGVDLKEPEFEQFVGDDFRVLDLRAVEEAYLALTLLDHNGEAIAVDEVYQLAADTGGAGYIVDHPFAMRNNVLINTNMLHAAAVREVKRYFFASSVSVYRPMEDSDGPIDEDEVYPANPDTWEGWEKLHSERMALVYADEYPMAVRIARIGNCYGPFMPWRGGREGAPGAICRKVASVPDGGEIKIWGDGSARRSYTYVDDVIEGIWRLTQSSKLNKPTNISSRDYCTVIDLVTEVARAAGKKKLKVKIRHGPVGVQARNFGNARIERTEWAPRYNLAAGMRVTYGWIANQVIRAGHDEKTYDPTTEEKAPQAVPGAREKEAGGVRPDAPGAEDLSVRPEDGGPGGGVAGA